MWPAKAKGDKHSLFNYTLSFLFIYIINYNIIDMKTLKLNKLHDGQLSKKLMKSVVGGSAVCQCGCCYAGSGGSSVHDNGYANSAHGLGSGGCSIKLTIITFD
jgi:natural product precursor